MNKSMVDAETQRAVESGGATPDVSGDFRTNRRVLVLSVLAVPIGIIGGLVGSRSECSKRKTIRNTI
jgi:hypothetical protein